MSYHSKRKQKTKVAMEKMQPEKDFNFCYNSFFKPILHIISEAVESNISDVKNLNQTYIDVVKIISSYNDEEMGMLNKNNDTSVISINNINNFYNNTSEKKVAIIEAINQDIAEFLHNVYNAKAGLYHYKKLYEGNIKGFTMKQLTDACLDDVEVSNFQVVRDDVCKYTNFALVKLFNNSTAENNTLLIEESFSVFDEQITKVNAIENSSLVLPDYSSDNSSQVIPE